MISRGRDQGRCCLAERGLPAPSRRQLDPISGSASPAAHVTGRKMCMRREGRQWLENCKLEMVVYQTAAGGREECCLQVFLLLAEGKSPGAWFW